MKVLFAFFALCIFIDFPALAEDATLIAPPELVMCKSDATCDHDPTHLEKFVADFYKWYVTVINIDASIPANRNRNYAQQRVELEKNEEAYLKKSLTPDFQEWRRKIFSDPEGYVDVFDPRFCTSDTDPMLCAQDSRNEWKHSASATLIAIGSHIAVFIVKLSPGFGNSDIPYLLTVRMRSTDGVWRIDGALRSF